MSITYKLFKKPKTKEEFIDKFGIKNLEIFTREEEWEDNFRYVPKVCCASYGLKSGNEEIRIHNYPCTRELNDNRMSNCTRAYQWVLEDSVELAETIKKMHGIELMIDGKNMDEIKKDIEILKSTNRSPIY